MAVIEVGVDKAHFHFILFLFSFVELLHLIAAEVEIPPEAEVRLPSELLFDDFSQAEVDEDWLVSLAADSYVLGLQVEVDEVEVVKYLHRLDQIIPVDLLRIIELHQSSHLPHCIQNGIIIYKEVEAELIPGDWATSQAVDDLGQSVLLCDFDNGLSLVLVLLKPLGLDYG